MVDLCFVKTSSQDRNAFPLKVNICECIRFYFFGFCGGFDLSLFCIYSYHSIFSLHHTAAAILEYIYFWLALR